jgi:hypothetical protein
MSNIQRVTISVPAALRERMDAVKGQVNWSGVAARAFEAKLLEIELAKKRGNMSKEDIVKRLKAAAEEDHEDYDDGKAAGQEWAAETATPKELKRLAEYMERVRGDTSARGLVTAVRPKAKDDPHAYESFWEEALGEEGADRIKDRDFLRGFGAGAVEVWDEVSDEL